MTFRIRKIEYTADGRRIVRDSDIDRAALTIGRDAGNDIALPDLAVEPEHACIEAASAGRLSVRALGTLGFDIDGRPTMQASVDPVAGAQLRFGNYRLGIASDSDGAVLVEVEDVASARDQIDTSEDKRGFSLAAASMPGKRLVSWIAVIGILLAFLALPVLSHLRTVPQGKADPVHATGAVINDKSWNPGPLSRAHQSLSGKCESCHVRPFESVRNETCQTCHKDTHDHAAAKRLTAASGSAGMGKALRRGIAHGFGRQGPGACVDCHVEHIGTRPMDAPRQQFCADCHAGMKGRLPDSKLGDVADFGTSHPQFGVTFVADAESRRLATASLDAHPREDSGLAFSHKIHLDQQGGVAKMAVSLGAAAGYGKPLECAACHHRSADGVTFKPVAMEQDCAGCHSLAYAKAGSTVLRLRHGDVAQMAADLARAGPIQPIVQGRPRPGEYGAGGLYRAGFAAKSTGFGPGLAGKALARDGVCGECHTPILRNGKLAVKHVTLVSRYMANGWFDHSAHKQTTCATCHAAKQSKTSADVLMPSISKCRDCHLGEAASAPKVPSGCAMCHAYHTGPQAPASDRRPEAHDRGAAADHLGLRSSLPSHAADVTGDAHADRATD